MIRKSLAIAMLATGLVAFTVLAAPPKDRKAAVLDDKKEIGADARWVYNDFAKGAADAKKDDRPMLVVFRCVP